MAIRKTSKWYRHQSGSSKKRRFTDAQRAAYWKKKYLDLRRRMKNW